MPTNSAQKGISANVSRLSRSLGLENEILHLIANLQKNRNFQPSEMPKFWLAVVSGSLVFLYLQ